MKKIIFYISLSIIILYWIYLRFYELWTWSFWIDEWYSSIVSYFANSNNYLPILLSQKYDFSQYIFTFFQSISFSILWVSDFSARIPSFIFWILNIILYFIFSKEIFKHSKNKKIYIFIIMFLFVFSTWQIIWAREARFYEILSFIYLLSVYFLWKYFVKNKESYFLYFLFSALIWIFFHPFCFWLIITWFLLFIYKTYKKKDSSNIKKIIILFIIINIYLIIDLFVKYISNSNTDLTNIVKQANHLWEYNFLNYIIFYIKNIYSELWIVFISYIFMIIYFLKKWKYIEFILFWLLVILNIIVISNWYMAHTRYMFHLYSIITFIWSLWIIIFFNYLVKIYKFEYKKIFILILIFLFIFSIIKTYKITLIPQRYYYIDYTSPKPNFKLAYEHINKNLEWKKIISWFPHLCYWYNINENEKCNYWIKINLIWTKKNINNSENEIYTNTKYLNNLDELKDIENYVFVIDDLTLKNTENKELLNDIINNCTMIYKDVWDYQKSNFIWIWSCK